MLCNSNGNVETIGLNHVRSWKATTSGDARVGIGCVRTALLDTLDGGTGDCLVDNLGGILDDLYWALARNWAGAEQADLAGDLLTEHGDVWCLWVLKMYWCAFVELQRI
jgi:hypothetical protein